MASPMPASSGRVSTFTSNTFVSVGLVVTLVVAALYHGRQLQRIDAMEETLRELRTEVSQGRAETQEVLRLLVQQQRATSSQRPP